MSILGLLASSIALVQSTWDGRIAVESDALCADSVADPKALGKADVLSCEICIDPAHGCFD